MPYPPIPYPRDPEDDNEYDPELPSQREGSHDRPPFYGGGSGGGGGGRSGGCFGFVALPVAATGLVTATLMRMLRR